MLKYKKYHYGEWIKERWYPHYFKPLFYEALNNLKESGYNLFWLFLFPLRIIIQILHLIVEGIIRIWIKIFKKEKEVKPN